jgi:hypothetical protein
MFAVKQKSSSGTSLSHVLCTVVAVAAEVVKVKIIIIEV